MKRERCDDCGKRDGDLAPDGRILLVFEPGLEGDPKLCAPCLEARRSRILARLDRNPEFVRGLARIAATIAEDSGPPAFVDPLEQLELGRAA